MKWQDHKYQHYIPSEELKIFYYYYYFFIQDRISTLS